VKVKQFFLIILVCLAGCQTAPKETGEAKPLVLVTIPPYAYLVNRIAQGQLKVRSIIPPATNLHIYEPSPREVAKMGTARLWIQIGEPFEKKIFKALHEKNPELESLPLWEHTRLLTSDDTELLSPCGSDSGHSHEGKDLHFWMSPKVMLSQAYLITKTLAKIFPEDSDLFHQNFQEVETDLEALNKDLENILEPFKGEALLLSHPSFGYFCKDYDMVQLSVECEGKDPRPRDIETLLKNAKKYHIRAVLTQAGFNNKGADMIAKKLGLTPHEVDPFAYSYITNMLKIASEVTE